MTAFKITMLCLLCVSTAYAQPEKTITIGTKETLFSKVLNEKRDVWVHLPNNSKKKETDARYPVVYVLDGEEHFYSVTGLVHQMSQSTGNTAAPQMIIVSILSTDRARDYTPTRYLAGFGTDSTFARTSGGADAFTSYIERELIPHIDSLYPTAPYRTLIGHSLGGLLVVNTLLNHTGLFQAYVALEPSLWWDGHLMLKQAQALPDAAKFKNKSFYMAIGNTMKSNADTAVMRKDTTEGSIHFRAQLDFADILKQKQDTAGLRWSYGYYKNENHTSIPLIGTYDALRFIFDYHQLVDFNRLWDPAFNSDSAIRAHYALVSSHLGYAVPPPRDLVDGLGHAFLEFKMERKAEALFTMNLENYPQRAESHTALGDLYAAKGDVKAAVTQYKKALLLKNDPELRKKVADLAKKK